MKCTFYPELSEICLLIFFIFLNAGLWYFHNILGSHTAETHTILSFVIFLLSLPSKSSLLLQVPAYTWGVDSLPRGPSPGREGQGETTDGGGSWAEGCCWCSLKSNGQFLRGKGWCTLILQELHVPLRLANSGSILIIQSIVPALYYCGPTMPLRQYQHRPQIRTNNRKAKVNKNTQRSASRSSLLEGNEGGSCNPPPSTPATAPRLFKANSLMGFHEVHQCSKCWYPGIMLALLPANCQGMHTSIQANT